MYAEILNLPLQAHFIPTCNPFQVQSLIKRQFCPQTAHLLVFFPHIENIHVQVSADKCLSFAKTHFIHGNVTLVLDQSAHIRLCIWYIIICIKRYLAGCTAFYLKHLHTFHDFPLLFSPDYYIASFSLFSVKRSKITGSFRYSVFTTM